MTDFSEDEGFIYDQTYHPTQPDWSYSDDPVVI